VNTIANNMSVLFGKGGGTFAPPVNLLLPGTAPSDVAIGDVDGDGKPDLVVTNTGTSAAPDNTATILFNLGGGVFSASAGLTLRKNAAPKGVAIADLNHDGIGDIVVTDSNSNVVSVFKSSHPLPLTFSGDFTTGAAPVSVVIADFDGDGKLDLATANANSTFTGAAGGKNVSILLGNGDGTFQTHRDIDLNPSSGSMCADPRAIVAADLNGDHKVDLAVACGGGTVSVLLGNGDGTFATPVSYSTVSGAIGAGLQSIAAADFDGKNGIDLALADGGNHAVFLLNNGNGTFSTSIACQPAGQTTMGIATADFDADKKPDIAVANALDGTVSILLNAGTIAPGACGTTPPPPANFTVTLNPSTVTTAAGTLVTYTVTVNPGPGFSGAVALTCASTAPASGCSLDPKTVSLQGGPVTSSLSVKTNVTPSGGAVFGKLEPSQSPLQRPGKPFYAMLCLGGAGLFGLVLPASRSPNRRKRLFGLAIATLLAALLLIALQACSGASFGHQLDQKTPPGSYVIGATGTVGSGSTAPSASGTATLVVH
jgi:hypothetical protein